MSFYREIFIKLSLSICVWLDFGKKEEGERAICPQWDWSTNIFSEVHADRLVDTELPTQLSCRPLHCTPCCLFPIAVPSPAISIYMLTVFSIPSPSGFRLSNPVCLLVAFRSPSAVPKCWRVTAWGKQNALPLTSTAMCLDCFGSYPSTGTSRQKGLAEECYSLRGREGCNSKRQDVPFKDMFLMTYFLQGSPAS